VYRFDNLYLREINMKNKIPPKALLILSNVCAKYETTIDEIISTSRKQYLVDARTEIYFQLREEGYSLSRIGSMVHRSHATVLHSLNKQDGKNGYNERISTVIGSIRKDRERFVLEINSLNEKIKAIDAAIEALKQYQLQG
jgi:chromosomal replication initiation ATPase DnaA